MLRLIQKPNSLQKKVEKEGWSRKTVIWRTIDAEAIPDFPRLTFEELTELTLGCYQIKQARSYTEEHLKDDGSYELFLYRPKKRKDSTCQNPIETHLLQDLQSLD